MPKLNVRSAIVQQFHVYTVICVKTYFINFLSKIVAIILCLYTASTDPYLIKKLLLNNKYPQNRDPVV